jgi:hypothetical protein
LDTAAGDVAPNIHRVDCSHKLTTAAFIACTEQFSKDLWCHIDPAVTSLFFYLRFII